jgi:hypothetical protein
MQTNSTIDLANSVNSNIEFSIDELCGHIKCNLYSDLWCDKQKPNVFNIREGGQQKLKAIQAAKDYLIRLNRACKEDKYVKSGLSPIIPQFDWITFKDIYLVPHHSKPNIDHWLCRFLVEIPDASQNKIPVIGSNIDIRIGNNFKVVGFESFWRPTLFDFIGMPLLDVDHENYDLQREEHNHEDEDAKDKTLKLVYLLEGSQNPQNVLTPYYLKQDGHSSYFFPASNLSLEINFFQEFVEENIVNVHANVLGGSGDYSFHWSYYNITEDEWKGSSIISLGNGKIVRSYNPEKNISTSSMIQMKEGVYNVILSVGDNQTGVVKQKQVMIYTNLVKEGPSIIKEEKKSTIENLVT